ncbi:PREDICTED: F-box/kelch-repeat protein At3g23880-like [Erythranthe guttata]|nr:PREDICTED: F-box/kelch-repeat protein At3g23880-like [Erythranthe guttata]|eukprot:XP_012843105.1 PREDICTED: F-box/kelch-repeat protein At3g23880-like [Erythranthe guttata]
MIHNLSVLSVNILGSCNGPVLATVNWKYLIIWNPSTREAKNIICFVGGIVREPGYFVYGFGCDEHTNNYKIVRFFFSVSTCHAEMYSSRTNSWKKIENYHKVFEYGYSGKFVNGRLHWMAVSRGCYTSWEIGSLDLVEENFGTLARPDYFLKYSSRPNLENLGGYLSLICFDDGNNIHIWGMTKYDEAESWTKFWTLFNWIEDFKYYATTTPFWVTKNGDTAVAFGPYIIVFDKKDESASISNSCGSVEVRFGCYFKVPEIQIGPHLFVESLVSPFGDEHPAKELRDLRDE